jgi:hypothetical protein
MSVLPQFTVAGRPTTVHVAEGAASSRVTMTTPRRKVSLDEEFDLVRGARNGSAFYYGLGWGGYSGWVSPTTRRPTVGTLRTYTSGTFTSPAGISPGYVYNLDFTGPAGRVPPQHFSAGPATLAAVTERYYQDVPTRDAGWDVSGGTLAQIFTPVPVIQFRMPSVQTQYFSAGRDLLWDLETVSNLNQFSGGDDDDFRWYAGGQHETQDWNAFPLHPAAFTTLGGPAAVLITPTSAARVGNRLLLDFTPFSDNQFGHTGPGFGGNGSALVTGSYQVDQDGRRIARGSALNGIPAVRLSARPSQVRFTLTAHRYSSFFPLSSGSQTVWTWRSRPEPSARVPRAWFCWFNKRGQLVHRCAVQHLMSLSYQVRGMSLTGQTRPGPQVVDVTAGHIQLGGTAKITGATARVSFNDGDSWFPAHVTALGGGRFKVAYSAPAGVDVTLRVSARDAAGGSISETIVRGYGVSK